MTYWEILLLSVALAVDAMVVGATIGLCRNQSRQVFRISFHFGLFQALFPLVGSVAGTAILNLISTWDHWLVFAILSALGIKTIWEAFASDKSEDIKDPTKGLTMVALSVAVSIDALGVGISLPAANVSIIASVICIGLTTWLLTAISMKTAEFIKNRLGKKLEIAGGLILIFIGIRILVMHLQDTLV